MQIRHIAHSRYPRVRAISALAMLVPTFLVLFAGAYFVIGYNDGAAFTEHLNRTGALYFTVTVFSTVGFGDIAPRTDLARVTTMLQMLGDLALLGIAGKVLIGAVNVGLQRSRAGETSGRRDAGPGT
jgi:voltage-gated potassium channel